MVDKLLRVLCSIIRSLFCDKNSRGSQTGTPSFSKFAFWTLILWFLPRPEAFGQYWFYTVAALLAYILFGTKFIPAFFAYKDDSTRTGGDI